MSEQSLNVLEHWMKTVITERGGLSEKLDAAARSHGLSAEDVIAEKRGLSAWERLAVYTGGYVLRLLECMRADFPVLRGFVGDSVFDAFAKAYIITIPPSSHSLYELGADFPRFLEETKPKNVALDAGISVLIDLPPELARLERARAEVMRARGTEDDAPATEPLSPFAVLSEGLTIQTTPCLRLLEMTFPLVDFLKSSDAGERTEPLAPRTEPPAPHTAQPAAHAEPSAPHPEPSAPHAESPAQHAEPPAPRTEPPAPRTEPPAPRTEPPAPRTDPPAPRISFVAVGRSNYRLHVEEIPFWQFAFLKACERPTSSYSAVQVAALESGRVLGQVLADVAVWLPVAFGLGFLRQVV